MCTRLSVKKPRGTRGLPRDPKALIEVRTVAASAARKADRRTGRPRTRGGLRAVGLRRQLPTRYRVVVVGRRRVCRRRRVRSGGLIRGIQTDRIRQARRIAPLAVVALLHPRVVLSVQDAVQLGNTCEG